MGLDSAEMQGGQSQISEASFRQMVAFAESALKTAIKRREFVTRYKNMERLYQQLERSSKDVLEISTCRVTDIALVEFTNAISYLSLGINQAKALLEGDGQSGEGRDNPLVVEIDDRLK
jgi:hypothetical protein